MIQQENTNSCQQKTICVVGTGPAGMAVAHRLAELGHQVTLVESGWTNFASRAQSLSDALIEPSGTHATMKDAVSRQWGGTSNLWGGRCVPLDPVDFISRPELGVVGWPFAYSELSPYWGTACGLASCGDSAFTTVAIDHQKPLAENFTDDVVMTNQLERWSSIPKFSNHLGLKLLKMSNVRILLGKTAVGFESSKHNNFIDRIILRNTTGLRDVSREHFDIIILACGGVESTRLLLNAHTKGQVNIEGNALLGKHYMGHLSGKIASIKFSGSPQKTEFGFIKKNQYYVRRRITFSQKEMINRGLLNIALWLDNPPITDPNHRSGILSSAFIAMSLPFIGARLAPAAIRKSLLGKNKSYKKLSQHLLNIFAHIPSTIVYSIKFLWKRYLEKPRIPGFFIYSKSNTYALHYHGEQSSNANSTIKLSKSVDETGLYRASISLKFQRNDAESVVSAHRLLDKHLQNNNIGKLEYWYPEDKLVEKVLEQANDGFHQLGTVRMAYNSSSGVADPFGRIFGSDNLYVCSSALFPTSGQANPTLTLLALALRQADHINSKFGESKT